MNKVIKIMDTTYNTVPEVNGCIGCAFSLGDTDDLCNSYSDKCGVEEFIWVVSEKEEAKYSMEEIKKIISMFTTFSTSTWADIQNRLEKLSSPEYAEYLRLKDKFEGTK